jgi:hypothetical protein
MWHSWRDNDDEAKIKLNARMALSIALQDTGSRLKVYQMDMLQDFKNQQTASTGAPKQ